jgi:hypothetical protein
LLAGYDFTNFGGFISFSPPVGAPIFAQAQSIARRNAQLVLFISVVLFCN